MRKRDKTGKGLLYLSLIFLISFLHNASTIGIGSTGDNVIFFKPNAEKSFYFELRSIPPETNVELYVEGDLKEYVTLSELSEDGIFVATVSLPEGMEELGIHKVFVNAKEVPNVTEGTVAAVTAVAIPIKIIVPYPGKYIEATLETPNINVGDTAEFVISVTSLGEQDIDKIKGYVTIYSPDGKEIASIETEEKYLATNSIEKLYARWQTTDQVEGAYSAVATVFYDGAKLETEQKIFMIGALVLKILKVTDKFEKDKVNPFIIEAKSEWANKIQNVNADIKILGEDAQQIDSFETPTIEFEPFERKEITAYWNTKGIDEGVYTASIDLNYADKKIEGEYEILVEKKEEPGEKKFPFFTLVYVLILVFIVVVYYTKKRKK